MASSHVKRWITGLTAIPILVLVIQLGGFWFAATVALVAALSMWEYLRIVFGDQRSAPVSRLRALAVAMAPVMVFSAHGWPQMLGIVFTVNTILAVLLVMKGFQPEPNISEAIARQVLGMAYIGLPLGFLVLIRSADAGISWVYFSLVMVFCCDIGAFYAGTYKGRRKLCPSISPGKTVEGALGGLVAVLVVGVMFRTLFLPQIPFLAAVALALLVAVVAPCGDLFESMLKRIGGIKDSGNLLPGHGGFLDRIDALLFVIPVIYFFQLWVSA